jgi:hypothetical protein
VIATSHNGGCYKAADCAAIRPVVLLPKSGGNATSSVGGCYKVADDDARRSAAVLCPTSDGYVRLAMTLCLVGGGATKFWRRCF